jgi:hypothetical protein
MNRGLVDHDWYLTYLVWVPALMFAAYLGYALWSGSVHMRGPIVRRVETPSSYWFAIGVLTLMLIISVYFALSIFRL